VTLPDRGLRFSSRRYTPECVEGCFSEVRLSHMGRISTAPCWQNLMTSSTIQRRPQKK
jgi:hypothetical protein